MRNLAAKRVVKYSRQVLEDCVSIQALLRDPEIRERAVAFFANEVTNHHSGPVDYIIAPEPSLFFPYLANAIHRNDGSSTVFHTVNDVLHYLPSDRVLQVQEMAHNRDNLLDPRERIRRLNGGISPKQFVGMIATIAAPEWLIEMGGDVVVSLSHGCRICGTTFHFSS